VQILITVDSTEPTLQSDHQKKLGGLFWVIKRNYQLRWISVFLQQEKGWPELEPLAHRFALAAGVAVSVGFAKRKTSPSTRFQ
jgi:hypothetical protein